MTTDNFNLKGYNPDKYNYIDQAALEALIEAYKQSLIDYPITQLTANDSFEFIHQVKRVKWQIGPYKNLTVFEIANRIYSDLVVLEGAQKVFENPKAFQLEDVLDINLLLSNISGYDLTIRTSAGKVHGEAFNVAPSFFKGKIRTCIKKLEKDDEVNRALLFFNSDAISDQKQLETYMMGQKEKNENLIGYVSCDLKQWQSSNKM